MAKQLYEVGDVIHAGTTKLEVVGVAYQERDGEKVDFVYSVKPDTETKQRMKAEAVSEKERAKLSGTSDEDAALDESKLSPEAAAADEDVN